MHVLLIGLGNMGMKYLAKLEELKESLILCDIDPYKNVGRYPFYCHFGEVKETVSRVIIAVNPEDHVTIAYKFLLEGIPVLLEKPPALNSKEFSLIAEDPNLEISEIELYSFPVKNYPAGFEVEEIEIERLNRGKGYLNPFWDLAWHDLYILQYLFGEVEIEKEKRSQVWELEGHANGIPFKLKTAWEFNGEPRRRWILKGKKTKAVMDFIKEEISYNGLIKKRAGGDKLKEMVADFLRGLKRRGSCYRAMKNLKLLESLQG